MTTQRPELSTEIEKLKNDIHFLNTQIQRLKRSASGLATDYILAGEEVGRLATDDVRAIQQLRQRASQIVNLLESSEISGRFDKDARRNRRSADVWRMLAIASLLGSAGVAYLTFPTLTGDRTAEIGYAIGVVILFGFCAMESNNHRRREFDRTRIALRVSALEAFMEQKRDQEGRLPPDAEKLRTKFVTKHFIDPELDSNDMGAPEIRVSMFRSRERYQGPRAPIGGVQSKS